MRSRCSRTMLVRTYTVRSLVSSTIKNNLGLNLSGQFCRTSWISPTRALIFMGSCRSD
jgi:hypothetical protein